MQLAQCPDCKKMISLSATACPDCGRPIKEGDLTPISTKMTPAQWGCFIIAALLVLLVLISALNAPRTTDEDRMRQLEKMQQTGRDMYK